MQMTASCMFPLHQGTAVALNGLQSCLASVQSWMSRNKLKLNPDKIKFLLIGDKQQWSKYLSMFPMQLFSVETNPANSAWNLGVILDKNVTFCSHKSAVCSSCFYHIQDLQCIPYFLDLDGAKLLATALVSSHLDHCNSHMYVVADTDLTKLQCVQNQLVCVATKSPPFTHSVPLLHSLPWLPVKFRILFKISLLT